MAHSITLLKKGVKRTRKRETVNGPIVNSFIMFFEFFAAPFLLILLVWV
jgi:hypothetical protein